MMPTVTSRGPLRNYKNNNIEGYVRIQQALKKLSMIFDD